MNEKKRTSLAMPLRYSKLKIKIKKKVITSRTYKVRFGIEKLYSLWVLFQNGKTEYNDFYFI